MNRRRSPNGDVTGCSLRYANACLGPWTWRYPYRLCAVVVPKLITLRRAAAVYAITALQSEYSLWAREAEIDVFSACGELGTSFVAFAPLGRGFLTDTIKSAANLAPDDYRRQQPRFNGPAAEVNTHLVNQLADIARANDYTFAQLALAWILSARPTVIPIPGVRRMRHLQDNVAAARTALSPALRASLDRIFHIGAAAGARYDADGMRLVGK
jgi:aryl-alcohol dehydrogenase-like predicted oxidoreductase